MSVIEAFTRQRIGEAEGDEAKCLSIFCTDPVSLAAGELGRVVKPWLWHACERLA